YHRIQLLLPRVQDSGRADENIDTRKTRLDVYHNQTSPLREYYLNEGQYIPVDGNRSVDEIFADIKSYLDKQLD
ncbi:MAG: adenylate kinase, partial [Muribaculaceae bacterium]|nr:adenylate kinase [Muribaculaceae bacterium]